MTATEPSTVRIFPAALAEKPATAGLSDIVCRVGAACHRPNSAEVTRLARHGPHSLSADSNGVYLYWGTPGQRRLDRVTPAELASYEFAAGSMGPKAEAAARFAARTGQRAAIGSLADIPGIVAGNAGTSVWAPAGLRTSLPAASGTRITVGAQAGEATPRTTWSPPSGTPRRLAGAG